MTGEILFEHTDAVFNYMPEIKLHNKGTINLSKVRRNF